MRIPKTLAAGVLVLTFIAVPRCGTAQSLMVTGYADFEATWNNPDGDGNKDLFFDNHHFNLIMIGQVIEDLFAAVEIEYEHAGEEIALEYGYFGYTGITNLRIMAGKFIVPFGRFNKDLHPTIINKMPDRPHGFANILPQTYNDVGLWVSGGAPIGQTGNRFVYDGFVVNGLMGAEGGNIRGFRGNDRESRTGDRDDNKAVGARIGLELAPYGLDFGGSIYRGNYSDDAAVDLALTLFGLDAAYRKSGFEARIEFVRAEQEIVGGDLIKQGGYGQVSYLVQGQYEPVLRYSTREMPGAAQDQGRLSFGFNYYLKPASALRFAYHLNMEEEAFESDNNQIVLQWNIIL